MRLRKEVDAIGEKIANLLDASDSDLDWNLALGTINHVDFFIVVTIGTKEHEPLGPLTREEGEHILDVFSAPCSDASVDKLSS